MKIEEHEESFRQHKEAIFDWAIDVKGIENAQRVIGLHASRAIIDLLSIYLQKEGKIDSGKQINHRWFKSWKVLERLPKFRNKEKIIGKIVELENECEKLSYGSKKGKKEVMKVTELFRSLEKELKGMIECG